MARGPAIVPLDVNVVTPVELAWAAGFIDGEGCFRCVLTHSINVHLSAAQVDRRPLDRLQGMFGGSIRLQRAVGNRRDCWHWDRTGAKNLKPIIEALRPYLVVKAEVADALMAVVGHVLDWKGNRDPARPKALSVACLDERRELAGRVKALNRVGRVA